ncbi:MAG: hypothetical protein LBE91_00480 [Tannerella sp.]|jgi:hypothetical protein|nr:hypothetical protein [Tannerella sp.]
MDSFLEKYLDRELTFTKLVPELIKPLTKNKGLILANLLGKMQTLNADETVHRIYGKAYHFEFSKKHIAQKELLIDYKDFNRDMKELSEYVNVFSGRKKGDEGGYNTTYFFLKKDRIRALFDSGAAMLGKPVRKLSDNKDNKAKQSTPKGLPDNIAKSLKTMNETERKYRNGEISEGAYTQTIQENKGLIMSNKFNLIKNNYKWEIKH